jgi:hypothetical protein
VVQDKTLGRLGAELELAGGQRERVQDVGQLRSGVELVQSDVMEKIIWDK